MIIWRLGIEYLQRGVVILVYQRTYLGFQIVSVLTMTIHRELIP